MFSKASQFMALSSVAKKILTSKSISLNSGKYFSTKIAIQNYNFPKDYSKELNIYKTFVPELRPELIPDSRAFKSLWPSVKNDILEYCKPLCVDQKSLDYIEKALEYNVPNGKQFRPMQVIMGFRDLVDKNQQTPEMMHKIYMLCWAMELVLSIAVIHDDMLDDAWIRRGFPCWHRLPEVGIFAVSDYILIINFGFLILEKHCKELPCYKELFKHIWEGIIGTHIGQTIGHVTSKNVLEFSSEESRAKHVGCVSQLLFYTPISMLYSLTGRTNREAIHLICNEMGHYHQCQNDFLDVFDFEGALIKTSNDIETGKCTWIATTCVEHANDEQKQIIVDNYGKNDPVCVERIKNLFLDMNMPDVYKAFSYEKYDYIKSLIENAACDDSMKIVLFKINDLTFHRKITI